MKENAADPKFEALLEFLKQSRGFDFTGYKRTSLCRRVTKRMQDVEIDDFDAYVDYLEVHPEEFAELFDTILINVTGFFRDKPAWDFVVEEIVPRIAASKKPGDPVRAWSVGCSSGEEAYTLAIILAEAMGEDAFRRRVKIYATDVDESALTQARHASYSLKQIEDVPEELRKKYFETAGSRYTFRPDLRRSVIFGCHDLIQDAPISALDLLVCRNTLMYLNAESQARILARFHFALNETGYLFLGKAEMLLTHARLFRPVELRYRVFSKVPRPDRYGQMAVMAPAGEKRDSDDLAAQARMREMALDAAPYALVMVDPDGNVSMANELARRFFNLDPRDVGRPLRDLEISYRPAELRSLLERAYQERRPVTVEDVERRVSETEVQFLDVRVTPLLENGGKPLGATITFRDVTRRREAQTDLERTKQDLETANEELQSTNEELQSTNEELETTNEELQSSVEELQTTNEELQSTNEEMETMNEELQSTNAEMESINTELRSRTEELNGLNAFLESVLASVKFGVLVVDRKLTVMLWNEQAEDLWGMRQDEAVGQPLTKLDIGLPVDKLEDPVRAVLSGETSDDLVLGATNRRGKSIRCRVTCRVRMGAEGDQVGVVVMMEEEAK